ncbi:MAG TPA: phosphatase PAP2 family protein [Bacteroidales bacterium]|nr:phosphatase PAP2 family protein [Bacteroidales bacterium]
MKKYLIFLLLLSPIVLYSQNIDIDILKDINLNRNKNLDGVFRVITDSASTVAYGLAVLLLVIAFRRKNIDARQRSVYVAVSVTTTAIIATILKYSIHRPRPFITYPFLEKVTSGGSPSFPSGHTTDAFAIATAVSLAYPKWYIIIPSYIWAIAVAYSRMCLGVHYPSDVLVGAFIGIITATIWYKEKHLLYKKIK